MVKLRVPRALPAVATEAISAFGSFLLQLLAARQLGPAGFGTFAVLFGSMVMASAVSTGLIGDSLTVLDRHDPPVRAALLRITWVVVGGCMAVGLIVSLTMDGMSIASCFAFVAAMGAFMVADLFRRTLMALLQFWRLVVVDATAATVAVAFVGVAIWRGPVDLTTFLLAIVVGQLTVSGIALLMLPARERVLPRSEWGAWRLVVGFGSWRAAQQFVRPTTLNVSRWIVLLAAGQAAVGELEATRVLVAPAMLLVQGVGSYLFSSYAADRGSGMDRLLRRADRAAGVMLCGSVLVGGAAALALPHVGDLLVGGEFTLSIVAVLGWAGYAASCAAVLPFGSLAAITGRQRFVFTLRVADAAFSLTLVAAALLAVGVSTDWVPWLLSVGSMLGGLMIRQVILSPEARRRRSDLGALDAALPSVRSDQDG
jgi:O-antigen/teichoic acid export membrane protein